MPGKPVALALFQLVLDIGRVALRVEDRVLVAEDARIGEDSIRNAATYQDFFVVLDKAMFLTLNKVD